MSGRLNLGPIFESFAAKEAATASLNVLNSESHMNPKVYNIKARKRTPSLHIPLEERRHELYSSIAKCPPSMSVRLINFQPAFSDLLAP